MFSLVFRRVLSRVVTLAFTLSPCLSYAAPPQDQVGVLVGFNWNVGDVHPDQSRWQANFALGSTGNIVRSIYEAASINGNVDDSFQYEYIAGYYHERSLLPLQWSTDSMGNSLGRLYGVPVMTKFSPVFNASGSSTGADSTIVSNPWVWVGAVVVGVAAAAGGGGGGGSNSSSTNSGGTLIGGDECNVVSGGASDPRVVSGCQVAGNDADVP